MGMDVHRAREAKGGAAPASNDEGPSTERRQEPLVCSTPWTP